MLPAHDEFHHAPTTSSPPLILHVTEAMGGGLEDAVHDFIRSAPQYRHALLFTRRGRFETQEGHPEQLVEVVDAGLGVRALARHYGPMVERLRPDVVHLHSAWAGLVGRARRSRPAGPAVVYSPHSYFFDRRDTAPAMRLLARATERALLRRTTLTAAVSPAEADEARRMGGAAAYIPNVVRLSSRLQWTGGQPDAPEVLIVGRIAAQKDPRFLLQVVRQVRQQAPHVRWTWVGAGEARAERRLRAAGVQVTGWVARAECLQRMTTADVYLHTAAWEGSPITLLEAAQLGVPIVARSIASLDSLGFDPSLRTPAEVALRLLRVLHGQDSPMRPPASLAADQARALAGAYSSVLPAPAVYPIPIPIPRLAGTPSTASGEADPARLGT